MSDSKAQSVARVLLYSHDRSVRDEYKLALGRRLASDLPDLELVECATYQRALKILDGGDIDLVVLDGEAVPLGGMGLARQITDEIDDYPPMILVVARVADAWLATWSKANEVLSYPVDPEKMATTTASLLRDRLAVGSAK